MGVPAARREDARETLFGIERCREQAGERLAAALERRVKELTNGILWESGPARDHTNAVTTLSQATRALRCGRAPTQTDSIGDEHRQRHERKR